MNGVVQKRDGPAEDAAENFGNYQAKSGDHGPAEHRRAQRRVRVTMMMVRMRVMHVTIVVTMFGIMDLITSLIVAVFGRAWNARPSAPFYAPGVRRAAPV